MGVVSVDKKLPRTALVIEDDEAIRHSLVGLLEDEGFLVSTASTLARARHILFHSNQRVGVLVLDLALSDGDGELLVEELHQLGRSAPAVVILSAFPDRAVPLAATYAIPHVVKPFDIAVVAATVVVAHDRAMRPHRLSNAGSSGLRRRIS